MWKTSSLVKLNSLHYFTKRVLKRFGSNFSKFDKMTKHENFFLFSLLLLVSYFFGLFLLSCSVCLFFFLFSLALFCTFFILLRFPLFLFSFLLSLFSFSFLFNICCYSIPYSHFSSVHHIQGIRKVDDTIIIKIRYGYLFLAEWRFFNPHSRFLLAYCFSLFKPRKKL